MKKRIFTLLAALTLILSTTSAAFAVDQRPNAEVYLGRYSDIWAETWYSNYCTATQSHVNLRVDNTEGHITYWVQYRGPNQTWQTLNTVGISLYGRKSSTYNINAKKGYDYRVKIEADWLSTPSSGVVVCY